MPCSSCSSVFLRYWERCSVCVYTFPLSVFHFFRVSFISILFLFRTHLARHYTVVVVVVVQQIVALLTQSTQQWIKLYKRRTNKQRIHTDTIVCIVWFLCCCDQFSIFDARTDATFMDCQHVKNWRGHKMCLNVLSILDDTHNRASNLTT